MTMVISSTASTVRLAATVRSARISGMRRAGRLPGVSRGTLRTRMREQATNATSSA